MPISYCMPKISGDIKQKLETCHFCQTNKRTQRKEPLKPTPLPERPWQKLATDLCEYNGKYYCVVSDYYSRFLEILQVTSTTTDQVVKVLKSTFARFGAPEQIQSDNATCYTSEAWKDFCKQYDIEHITSSPHNPQANGHAERAVQLAKRILKQDDPVLALMCYRATPTTSTGVSPAELLMGRKIRTTLPSLKENLVPRWPDTDLIRRRDAEAKEQQAFYFNRRHGVRDLPQLRPGDNVLLKLDGEKTWKGPASVVHESCTPRSYQVDTPGGGELRRNRRHLQRVPQATEDTEPTGLSQDNGSDRADAQCSTQGQGENNGHDRDTPDGHLVTRSGRVCKPVLRMDL